MARKAKACKNTSDNDIEAWVRAMYPEILRYCLFHCVSRSEAEDATQDTFLKAIRYGDKLEKLENQRAFLYRIARNTCIDLSRKQRPDALPEKLPAEEAALGKVEADADLELLLRGLPAQQRELLLLRYQQELSIREIAAVLGIPLRTTQSRLRAALKALRHMIGKEDFR